MSRANARGLELTWHKPSRRWRKRLAGRDLFFGGGKGVSDRESYRAALAKFRAYMDSRDAAIESVTNYHLRAMPIATAIGGGNLQALTSILALFKIANPNAYIPALSPTAAGAALPAHAVGVSGLGEAVDRRVAELTPQVKAIPPAPTENKLGVDVLIDGFLGELRRRFDQTKAAPETTPRDQRLGGSAFRNQRYSLEGLRTHFKQDGVTTAEDAGTVARSLASYRAGLDDAVAAGKRKGATAECLLKGVKPLFKWAWQNGHIAEMPRNLEKVTTKYGRVSSAKPLEVEVVKALWQAAKGDERLRCWMALALNCGFYSIDIATLKPEHLTEDGYIARFRHKTKIPGKHKLWPLTMELIRRTRDDRLGLLWTRQKRTGVFPLVAEHDNSKYDSISREFRILCDAAKVDASWSRFRDTSAHHVNMVAMNGKGTSDPEMVSQFLVHADARMARYYLNQDPAKLDRAKLDRVLMKLPSIYGLES